MIRIGMYNGKGANPPRLTRLLRRYGFEVTLIKKPELEKLPELGLDILFLPGGWYSFNDKLNRRIVRFARSGRGVIGSCAGAYLVGGYIPVIPGRVLRPNIRGRVYLEPQDGNHPILRGVVRKCTRHKARRWEPIAATHLGGPFILPKRKSSIVASFDFEGEIGAIVAQKVGRGRAVALSSHPEHPLSHVPKSDSAQKSRKDLPQGDERLIVRNAVLWAAGKRVPKG